METMHCELCGKEPEAFVLMPIRGKYGALETIGCLDCAISRGVYCTKHERPHLGFEDGTHACVECVEGDVRANLRHATVVYTRIAREFPGSEQVEIGEYLESLSFLISSTREQNLLRPIAMLARRAGTSFDEMLERVIRSRSAEAFTEGRIPA